MQSREPTLYLTQSLLNSWLYFINSDDEFADKAYSGFLSALRRETIEPTKPMLDGMAFEEAINATLRGETPSVPNEKWAKAVRRFSSICAGGQPQTPVAGVLDIGDLRIGVYGFCDYVKQGVIYDIKKVTHYDYGKYYASPQHPMYMRLLPEAKKFVYLIFDGTTTHMETYRPGDFEPIEQITARFITWLRETGHFDEYKKYWSMTEERKNRIYELQF